MRKLKHPNIIGFLDVFHKNNGKELNIIMEHADDGTIDDKIIEKMRERVDFGGETQYFSEGQILSWFT